MEPILIPGALETQLRSLSSDFGIPALMEDDGALIWAPAEQGELGCADPLEASACAPHPDIEKHTSFP